MNDMNVNLSNLSKSYYKGFITGSQALTGSKICFRDKVFLSILITWLKNVIKRLQKKKEKEGNEELVPYFH